MPAEEQSKPPSQTGREQTRVQSVYMMRTLVKSDEARLDKRLPATYDTYRQIRKQPTVALARALTIAPIVAGEWHYDADREAAPEWRDFIREQLEPWREQLLTTIMENRIDYGWSPWEQVYQVSEWRGRDMLCVKKFKSLLVDLTDIRVQKSTGAFAGFRQPPGYDQTHDVLLEPEDCLLVNFGVEGTNWYGSPLLENIRPTYAAWQDADNGARRYDKKIAGAHWIVTYPSGRTKVDGEYVDNKVIAEQILETLEASGSVAVPSDVAGYVEDLNAAGGKAAWSIELKDHASQQGSFTERLSYLDKLFVRGVLTPERAILETEYGTKADAGEHADWSLTQRELEHRHVVRFINKYVVARLLRFNYGARAVGKVRVVAAPLVDAKISFLREVYKQLLADPVAAAEFLESIDKSALQRAVGVPQDPNAPQSRSGMTVQEQIASTIRQLYLKVNPAEAA